MKTTGPNFAVISLLILIVIFLVPLAGAAGPVQEMGNGNTMGILMSPSGPKAPTTFTFAEPVTLVNINAYHYDAKGQGPPGTLGLRDQKGKMYGPWQTTGSTGQGGIKNAFWNADINVALPAGTYTVVDSNPATWSYNPGSNNQGFAGVRYKTNAPSVVHFAWPTTEAFAAAVATSALIGAFGFGGALFGAIVGGFTFVPPRGFQYPDRFGGGETPYDPGYSNGWGEDSGDGGSGPSGDEGYEDDPGEDDGGGGGGSDDGPSGPIYGDGSAENPFRDYPDANDPSSGSKGSGAGGPVQPAPVAPAPAPQPVQPAEPTTDDLRAMYQGFLNEDSNIGKKNAAANAANATYIAQDAANFKATTDGFKADLAAGAYKKSQDAKDHDKWYHDYKERDTALKQSMADRANGFSTFASDAASGLEWGKYGCDKGVDVLSGVTGPAGKNIKMAYKFGAGLGEGIGEGLIDRGNFGSHIAKGAAKGAVDVIGDKVTDKAFGKLEKALGEGKAGNAVKWLNTPVTPKADPLASMRMFGSNKAEIGFRAVGTAAKDWTKGWGPGYGTDWVKDTVIGK